MKLDQAEQFARLFLGALLVTCLTGLCVVYLSGCDDASDRAFGQTCMVRNHDLTGCVAACGSRIGTVECTKGATGG